VIAFLFVQEKYVVIMDVVEVVEVVVEQMFVMKQDNVFPQQNAQILARA